MNSKTVDMISFEGLTINWPEQTVFYKNAEIMLTNREFQVLYLLMRYPGQVFSKKQIYNQVTEQEEKESLHTIEITISRIRKKLFACTGRNNFIITIRGRGYKFRK